MKRRLVFLSLLGALAAPAPAARRERMPLYKEASAPVERRIDDLLRRMTLHEKVMQLRNTGSGGSADIGRIFRGESYGATHEMWRSAAETSETYLALQRYLRDSTRLGIPVLTGAEGIQGVLQAGCTVFPHAIAQGSTFNPGLIRRMTDAAGAEAEAIGIRQILSPVLDIAANRGGAASRSASARIPTSSAKWASPSSRGTSATASPACPSTSWPTVRPPAA